MAIKIKAKNKGKFNATKKKIGKSTEELTHSKNPVTRKRAIFAQNAKKWHHGNGGYEIPQFSNSGSQRWDNLSDSQKTESNKSSGIGVSQVSGYVGAGANALSPLWQGQDTSNIATRQDSATAPKVFGSIKEIGKAIPVVGGFVQAGDTLGKGFEAGINAANKKGGASKDVGASFAAFGQGIADPIAEHQKVWQLQKNKKISTGEAVGYSALNFLGGAGISNAILEKTHKNDLHPELNQSNIDTSMYQFNPREEVLNNPQLAPFGGSLEHYDLPKHSELPSNFPNTQMDGKGVQLEKNETMLKFPDGGSKLGRDYSFSPNLGFDKKGNPTIDESKVKTTFADASKKIDKSKTFGYDKANENSLKFKYQNLQNVAEATRQAKEGPDQPMQAANGGGVPHFDNSGSLWESAFNEGSKQYRLASEEEQFLNSIKRAEGTPTTKESRVFNPNAYTDAEVDQKLKNTKFAPGKLGPTVSYKGDPNDYKTKSKMTPGDIAQLAGSSVAPLTNLGMYLANKSEKVTPHLDNTSYTDPRIAKDFNPLYLAENAAKQNISATSDAVRRANLIGLASNMAGKAQDYSLGVDRANVASMLQRDQLVSGTNRFNAQARTQRDDLQAQNDARRRAFLTTAASQTGQAGVETGKAINNTDMNKIYANILKNYSAEEKEEIIWL